MMWQVATTGRAEFPDGHTLEASPRDCLDVGRWLYAQIDGPPKAELDVTSNNETITVILRANENGTPSGPASGAGEDS